MPHFNGFLDLMASRSFSSIWFWLVLVGSWSLAGRAVLGVPVDVITRARRAPEGDAGLILLDWLSLNLPRWQVEARDGAVIFGVAMFALASLWVLGFGYGLEMAQALVLLILPFLALTAMRLRLARRLAPLIDEARLDRITPAAAVAQVLPLIAAHRRGAMALSVLAVAVAAVWGTRQMILNNPLAF